MGCKNGVEPFFGRAEPVEYDARILPPAILRDVSMVDDEHRWKNPFVPGLRTTQDGRVALRVQGGPTTLSFYLFTPESQDAPIVSGPPGLQMMADPEPVQVVLPPAAEPGVYRVGHHTICEPTHDFAQPGERPNPYACGPGLANDCYDVHVISSVSVSLIELYMWGTPVTIEVEHPKTPDASIVRVELGTPVRGMFIPDAPEWAEINVTTDGRLLTGRLGGAPRDWTNPNTGETIRGSYDLVYSVLDEGKDPCDVTGWTTVYPMSHAPFDPNMARYGLAAYPFRDTEGRPIADGDDMAGSYPWVDREGTTLFMTAVPGTITEQSHTAFPRRCAIPGSGCETDRYDQDYDRGMLVAGLWTHGKLVHVDSMLNNLDWSVGMSPEDHWMVDLYSDEDGDPVSVRFGSGRGSRSNAPGDPGNVNIIDSLQNLHNHRVAARTITPRDVVWVMSTGAHTDEVVFDDFLDPRAFIVSNMQASITPVFEGSFSTGVPWHHNGQHRDLVGLDFLPIPLRYNPLDHAIVHDIHIQNAATTMDFAVPAYGLVSAGTGRTEPAALGGFYGRGFWLDGSNRIEYPIAAASEDIGGDWYVGLFVDARATDGASRSLLSFPDGSSIRLVGRETLQYVVGRTVRREVPIPPHASGFLHLGWHVRRDNTEITLLVDGFAIDRFRPGRSFFGVEEGSLIVGRGPDLARGERDAGFRGWIDEFKVLAHDLDPEVACNHAAGTLVQVDGPTLAGLASLYPDWAHAEVAAAAGRPAGPDFACFHDYTRDHAANLANVPADAESIRADILFPEGPLMAGAPRPDSSTNAFCLSCHSASGTGPMGLAALEYRPGVLLEDDPRRQPHQPPRRVFGNIPANWIPAGEGPGSPGTASVAPVEGALVDRWILPHAP